MQEKKSLKDNKEQQLYTKEKRKKSKFIFRGYSSLIYT